MVPLILALNSLPDLNINFSICMPYISCMFILENLVFY